MKNEKMNGLTLLIIIGVSAGGMFSLPYLRDTYFVALRDGLRLTNTQFGKLLSVYSIVSIAISIPCGWIASKYSAKKILIGIVGLTALSGYWYATFPTYLSCLIIFSIWGFTTTMYWPLLTKAALTVGGKNGNVKSYGVVESTRAAAYAIISFISVGLFSYLGSQSLGVQGVIVFYSSILLIVAIAAGVFIKDDKEDKVIQNENIDKFKQVIRILKNPNVWLLGMTIFITLSMYICSGMIIPYLEEVWKVSPEFAAIFGIFRSAILITAAGLIGGIISKKLNSVIKMIFIAYVVAIGVTIILILIPTQPMFKTVLIIVSLLLIFSIVINKTMYMAPTVEIGIRPEDVPMVSVVLSMIGFSCEMFMYTLVGNFVDKNPGIIGYRNVFYLLIFYGIIGVIIMGTLRYRISNKNSKVQSQTLN
ncbi:MFS transporter [Psychrilyobacter atlanticus]|uniref:MFS transporter n=1 Tax=Psychrilyobacter atlanticus TaxID=271091 RepID=UPI00048B24F3|nr:MFS transporter [Psychrilyobacter atlanticus]